MCLLVTPFLGRVKGVNERCGEQPTPVYRSFTPFVLRYFYQFRRVTEYRGEVPEVTASR